VSSSIDLDVPAVEPEPLPRVRVNALTTLAYRVGGLPFAFAITVITSRYLLPTGRGAFVLALLTVTLASTLLGSVGIAAAHELSRKEHTESSVLRHALVVALALGVVGSAVLFPIDLAFANRAFHNVAYAAFALPAVLVVQTLSSALVAVDRLRFSNLLQLLVPVVTLTAMLFFVIGLGRGTTGAVAAWVVAQIIVAAVAPIGTWRLWAPSSLLSLPRARVASMALLGLRLGVVNVVSLLNYRIELLILERERGLADVGLYSLATSLAELLWLISAALATATISPIVNLEDDAAAALVVARSIRWALGASALLGVALAAGGWFLIPPLFGDAFATSRVPLLILIPGVVAFAPGRILAVYFSMRQGQARLPLAFSLVSLVATTLVAVLLIPRFAATGAAIACTAGYVLSIAAALVWFARSANMSPRALLPRRSTLTSYRALARAIVGR